MCELQGVPRFVEEVLAVEVEELCGPSGNINSQAFE